MSIAIVTGSAGLIGSEASQFFAELGMDIIGIDNDMRAYFFGDEASTKWKRDKLETDLKNYYHQNIDIRNFDVVEKIFKKYKGDISLIIHTAAQPSHDWAAKEPFSDFSVNANGTLNLLEAARKYSPNAPFIFTSTNKVYGDTPNQLPLIENEKRWEIDINHKYHDGISEDMSIDQSTHSLFGASKLAADILVQEYSRYFDLPTVSFRGGCLTGPNHSGTQLHGFLAYLMKCAMNGDHYTIFGYKGKQVRDNIHSEDLIKAFYEYYKDPKPAKVYNIGGGRQSNCSMLEAIELCQKITGKKINYSYSETNRVGDHIWYISDLSAFKKDYPEWDIKKPVSIILQEMYDQNQERWGNNA